MVERTTRQSSRKDLTDLADLSRAPILSFLQKQVQPRAPRPKAATLAPAATPPAGTFRWILEYSPRRLLKWICGSDVTFKRLWCKSQRGNCDFVAKDCL